ncbi:6036_t:CDS:1 [Dentiscutata heterogama]|uniref:6036_t:CDS:1 n=1 Tax=Dentiscutata heterogama TaxID=1316150 RepID=A0ACA9NF26_9GLOM|nr:6036_t:CDS:1 [Dentiscutata heterogama]
MEDNGKYSVYVCLDTGDVVNSFPRDSNLTYKGFTDVSFASEVSVRLVSFYNKLKEEREKKDPEYFYINIVQQTKKKLLGKTMVAIYRLDSKLEKSDVTLIDRVEDDGQNTNSLYLSYDLIKRSIVSKEQYKDKNIIIISNNSALSNIFKYKFYKWSTNNFKKGVDVVTDEDYDGISDTEKNEKLTEFSYIDNADLLKDILKYMKINNNTINGLTSFKEVSHIIDKVRQRINSSESKFKNKKNRK